MIEIFLLTLLACILIKIYQAQRYTALICCLSRGHTDLVGYTSLIERNKRLERLKWSLKYDHVIFHEGNITLEHQECIASYTPHLRIRFVNVASAFFRSPHTVPDDGVCAKNETFPVGYTRMCRFWFVDFWKYTKGYKYLVRIDDDVHLDMDTLDPVMYCEKQKMKYACPHLMVESYEEVDGLDRFINAPVDILTSVPSTYAQVINLHFYSSRCVMEFIDAIDQSGCQLHSRWGDAPLMGLLVRRFTPEDEYNFHWKGFKGVHGSHDAAIG